jgi:thiol-disulfide isomerase/thioredoxin
LTRAARVALGILLVAASGPAGFLAYRLLASPPPGAAPSAAVPPAPRAQPRHPVPERLPDIKLPDGNGTPHSLADWHGHPLIVNFWATWCEPCRREIPLLKSLRHRYADMGLEVVGVAVDFREAVLPYVRQMDIDYPILIGEQDGLKAIDAFGMEAVFPFTAVADPDGRIVALKVGELHPDDADLILARLADVDAGRVSLTDARRRIRNGLAELAVKRAKGSGEAESSIPGKS